MLSDCWMAVKLEISMVECWADLMVEQMVGRMGN